MKTRMEHIAGDTPGTSFELAIHQFAGNDKDAPSAYLQAALHADEHPGVAALHYLLPKLRQAASSGMIKGSITIVPNANPIGAAQHLMSQHMGRFSLGSRVNFNRGFPVPDEAGNTHLDQPNDPVSAELRLKSRLLELAVAHDIVLDLHCDDESLQYLYVPDPLWPALADLAACLDARAVIRWSSMPDRAFEEAVFARMLQDAKGSDALSRRVVSTVELRGQLDVDPILAQSDAMGLYAFLIARGVISDEGACPELPKDFPAVPISHVEMVRAPTGGTLLYHVKPGDRVEKGDLLAEILSRPGADEGVVAMRAPQAGLVLTRRMRRLIRMGDDILKLVGDKPSANAKDGTLEA